jgi:capsular polysaccharide transport system permease protein
MRLARTLTRALAITRPPGPTGSHPVPAPAPAVPPAAIARPSLPSVWRRLAPAAGDPRAPRPARPSWRGLSFAALVVLPTAIAAAYYFAVAADQYVVEFRFTLSTIDPPRLDPLSLFAGNVIQAPATLESQILVQYIRSRAIVDAINPSLDLRRLFAPPAADWWSRLHRPAAAEDLVRYWRGQVDPFYDPADGTVTVRVRAFAPRDALRLARVIVGASERLVNDLSERARRDALRQATAEVTRAQTRLAAVLGQIRAFREREGMIDPVRAAAATSQLADRLEGALVQTRAELATLKTYMRDDAPSVRLLEARIHSLEAQRRRLGRALTGLDPAPPGTLSHLIGSYEELESRHSFAEAAYQHALQGLDAARANADRQHVFIASFIPPSLPEEPLYPRRWRALGTVALMAFAVWGIGGLAVQSIRDHLS